MTLSVHDNTVLGFTVDAVNARIVIRTEYRDGGALHEATNVRFEGVIGYVIRGDGLRGILFDIEEADIERVMAEHGMDFVWGERYGWPSWPAGDVPKDPRERIRALNLKVFRIQSVTVFDGFVIAREMVFERAGGSDF